MNRRERRAAAAQQRRKRKPFVMKAPADMPEDQRAHYELLAERNNITLRFE